MKGKVIVKYKFGVGANALMLAGAGALVVHTMIEMCNHVEQQKVIEELKENLKLNKRFAKAKLNSIYGSKEAKKEEEES